MSLVFSSFISLSFCCTFEAGCKHYLLAFFSNILCLWNASWVENFFSSVEKNSWLSGFSVDTRLNMISNSMDFVFAKEYLLFCYRFMRIKRMGGWMMVQRTTDIMLQVLLYKQKMCLWNQFLSELFHYEILIKSLTSLSFSMAILDISVWYFILD